MSCFPWLNLRKKIDDGEDEKLVHPPKSSSPSSAFDSSGLDTVPGGNDALRFTFRELETATKHFREDNLIGEGGFGKVYKGHLYNGQDIAVKRLKSYGHQGNQEFIVEVLMLRLLRHPNLVKLIGYCAEGDHRLLVYEYMRKGSLAYHLYENDAGIVLDWNTRMKIALGAAKGIQYLHCSDEVPVIYRDLKSSNILLDNEFNPKLSDFGLAKLGPTGDQTHVSTRIMGTYGYCAPEYAMSGKLSMKSDIYSFGVVLLELVSGRKAFDPSRKEGERSIVVWSRAFLHDRERSLDIVDARLEGHFPDREARRLIMTVISKLLLEDPNARPPIKDIVDALVYLTAKSPSVSL